MIDAPTLFESGAFKLCNFNVAILAKIKDRLTRIIKRDNLTKKAAIYRIKSQPTNKFYINNADGLILNYEGTDNLFKNILFLIEKLKILF